MKEQTDDRSRTLIMPTSRRDVGLPEQHTLGLFALLAILCLVVPGCLESAMSFSPDGKHLALVVRERLAEDKAGVQGACSYRLMVLSGRRTLKVLEDSRKHMLSGPAFSPDGKRLCYLRLPLPTEQEKQKQQAAAEKRAKRLAELAKIAPDAWTRALTDPEGALERGDGPQLQITDMTLPGVGHTAVMLHDRIVARHVTARLVVRDVATGKVVSTTDLRIPFAGGLTDYYLIKLRYGPRGKWVYLYTGYSVLRVHPILAECHILAAPAPVAELSPDGKTLAVATDRAIGFIAADGSRAGYTKWTTAVTMRSIAWADNDTLAVLSYKEGAGKDGADVKTLNFLPKGGGKLKTIDLELDGNTDAMKDGAPDGKHIVAAYGNHVYFLDRGGKVLKHLTAKGAIFASPTFRPDSKVVAIKRLAMVGENTARVAKVVFFSPDGKRLAEKEIPSVNPALKTPKQPAAKPAD